MERAPRRYRYIPFVTSGLAFVDGISAVVANIFAAADRYNSVEADSLVRFRDRALTRMRARFEAVEDHVARKRAGRKRPQ